MMINFTNKDNLINWIKKNKDNSDTLGMSANGRRLIDSTCSPYHISGTIFRNDNGNNLHFTYGSFGNMDTANSRIKQIRKMIDGCDSL